MEDQGDRRDWYYDYSLCESSSSDSDGSGDGNGHGNDPNGNDQGQNGHASQMQTETETHMLNHVHDDTGQAAHIIVASPVADAAASASAGSVVDSGDLPTVSQVLDQLSTSMNLPERKQQVDKQEESDSFNGEWASPDRAAGPQTPSNPGRSSTRSSTPDSIGVPCRSPSFAAPSDGGHPDADVDGATFPSALHSSAAPSISTGLDRPWCDASVMKLLALFDLKLSKRAGHNCGRLIGCTAVSLQLPKNQSNHADIIILELVFIYFSKYRYKRTATYWLGFGCCRHLHRKSQCSWWPPDEAALCACTVLTQAERVSEWVSEWVSEPAGPIWSCTVWCKACVEKKQGIGVRPSQPCSSLSQQSHLFHAAVMSPGLFFVGSASIDVESLTFVRGRNFLTLIAACGVSYRGLEHLEGTDHMHKSHAFMDIVWTSWQSFKTWPQVEHAEFKSACLQRSLRYVRATGPVAQPMSDSYSGGSPHTIAAKPVLPQGRLSARLLPNPMEPVGWLRAGWKRGDGWSAPLSCWIRRPTATETSGAKRGLANCGRFRKDSQGSLAGQCMPVPDRWLNASVR